jgi:hypothetical protein
MQAMKVRRLSDAPSKALTVLMNEGRAAFVRYCEAQRDAAHASGYPGAAQYWEQRISNTIQEF